MIGASPARWSLAVVEPGSPAKWGATLNGAKSLLPEGLRGIHCVNTVLPGGRLAATARHVLGDGIPLDVRYYDGSEYPSGSSISASGLPVPLEGVFTPFETAVGHAARFAQSLADGGLLHPAASRHHISAAEILRDKHLFRRHVNTVVAPRNPDILAVWSRELQASQLTKWSLLDTSSPEVVIVKPRNGSGSRGVRLIDLLSEGADRELASIGGTLNALKRGNTSSRELDTEVVSVEGYVEGEEFSVESFLVDGKVHVAAIHWKPDIYADRKLSNQFLEGRLVTLPRDRPEFFRLEAANRAVLTSISGIGNGVFHAEYRIDTVTGKIFPIEIGARPGGGMIAASVYQASGVDLYETGLRLAAGRPSRSWRINSGLSAEGVVFPPGDGVLERLFLDIPGRQRIEVGVGAEEMVAGALNGYLEGTSRYRVMREFAWFERQGPADFPLRRALVQAFASSGAALDAEVKRAEVWCQPGDVICGSEGAYLAGLLVGSRSGRNDLAALADMTAATGLCLAAFNAQML